MHYYDPMIMPSWILVDQHHHSRPLYAPPFNHIYQLQKECYDGIPYCVFQERVSNGARIDDNLIALLNREEQRPLNRSLDPLLGLRLKSPR